MTTTTSESTVETNRLLELLPEPHRSRSLRACDVHDAMKAKAAHATATRSAECETLVHTAIRVKRARLERVPRHKWTSLLQLYYFDKRDATIDEETIRKYVKTFPGFN